MACLHQLYPRSDRHFPQDRVCMLLIMQFSFVANPKNFHTWLLAPDRGFSHTSAVSNLAMVQHSMFDPLHADKQKLVIITHAEYLYRDSDMALCIY